MRAVITTSLDRSSPLPGYYPSVWPTECGGPRRQKAPRSPGLGLRAGERLEAHARQTGRWNVMFVQREPGELYLQGTTSPGDPDAYGWVERVDPETLEAIAASPRLPTGGHVWCGAILAHANGDLYTGNGRYVHRLDVDCRIVEELELPTDWSHNGLLALGDGRLVTKDIRPHEDPSTLLLLEPDPLRVVAALEIPEPSMGRIAADRTRTGEFIYVPGREHVYRFRYARGRLSLDREWQPRYRGGDGEQGLAWDSCIGGGSAWLMDNGDVNAVREMFRRHPNRAAPPDPARSGPPLGPDMAAWPGAQRLIRLGLADPEDIDIVTLFGEPRAFIVAPPVYVDPQRIVVAWDSANARLAALRYHGPGKLEELWQRPLRVTMQPMVYPDTGELVVNDYRREALQDDVVVLDLETGEERGRVYTGSPVPNGMFLTPGFGRDLYYCSNGFVSRITVACDS